MMRFTGCPDELVGATACLVEMCACRCQVQAAKSVLPHGLFFEIEVGSMNITECSEDCQGRQS